MTIRYHNDLIQGTEEWLAARRGLITASEMKLIMTPNGKPADNDKARAHLWELLAQRITGRTEPQYISDDMLRGEEEESEARTLYSEHYAPVTECGFVTNDQWGFTIGYSPDGLVGDDGLIEIKSRRQRFQVQTIVENVGEETIPAEYMLQIQTGLLVTGRAWCDFISFSNGLPMAVIRVTPIADVHQKIVDAAEDAEIRLRTLIGRYAAAVNSDARLIPTVYRERMEILA